MEETQMIIIKSLILVMLLGASSFIGVLISGKYKNRVSDLREMKNALSMFETKVRYTYEAVPEIFKQIAGNFQSENSSIAKIFKIASENMKYRPAGDAWALALEVTDTNMNKEDIKTLKGLRKLLGKTDVEGQLSEIELTTSFLDIQITQAEKEKEKNEKLYKTLGVVTGLAIVIILI